MPKATLSGNSASLSSLRKTLAQGKVRTVLSRTEITDQVLDPDRLRELKMLTMQSFGKELEALTPTELLAKWSKGEREHGILTDIFQIDADKEFREEVADCLWYRCIREAQCTL